MQAAVEEKSNQTLLYNFALNKLAGTYALKPEALKKAIEISLPEASALNEVHAAWTVTADNVAVANMVIWRKLKALVDTLMSGLEATQPEFVERPKIVEDDSEGRSIERTQVHEDIYMTSWGR